MASRAPVPPLLALAHRARCLTATTTSSLYVHEISSGLKLTCSSTSLPASGSSMGMCMGGVRSAAGAASSQAQHHTLETCRSTAFAFSHSPSIHAPPLIEKRLLSTVPGPTTTVKEPLLQQPPCSSSSCRPASTSTAATTASSSKTVVAFPLAQTGEGISECELIQWFVKEGQPVGEFERLCEVQSDKAAMEITSRYAGVVRRLAHAPGEVVKVGATLVDIEVDGPLPPGAVPAASPAASEACQEACQAAAAASPAAAAACRTAEPACLEPPAAAEASTQTPAAPAVAQAAASAAPSFAGVGGQALQSLLPGAQAALTHMAHASDLSAGSAAAAAAPAWAPPAAAAAVPLEGAANPAADMAAAAAADLAAAAAAATDPAASAASAAAQPSPLPASAIPAVALAAPAVRSLARDQGIDLAALMPGSGEGGRITRGDVMRAMEQRVHAAAAARQQQQQAAQPLAPAAGAPSGAAATGSSGPSSSAAPSSPSSTSPQHHQHSTFPTPAPGEVLRVPLRGYRRAMVKAMTAAASIPHFHYHDEVCMDDLIALRRGLQHPQHPHSQHHPHHHQPPHQQQHPPPSSKLTFLPFIIKALSVALTHHPALNSSLSAAGDELLLHGDHNIGVAVATSKGLVVPVVKKVQSLSVPQIAGELQRLQAAAASGALAAADVTGGTITVSNIGSIGGLLANPLINPPEVAIVALGRVRQVPHFEPQHHHHPLPVAPAAAPYRSVMGVSWGADHRAVDGAALAQFVNTWKALLEHPGRLLMELK